MSQNRRTARVVSFCVPKKTAPQILTMIVTGTPQRLVATLHGKELKVHQSSGSLPKLTGQKKFELLIYHQNGLSKKFKVHQLRK